MTARFRIKKKQRSLNLERSVSDLTGRAEELEREAAELRRENGWLKEIVMLKGSRIAENITRNLGQYRDSSQSKGESSGGGEDKRTDDALSEDSDSEDEGKKKKGKGKKVTGKGKGKATK